MMVFMIILYIIFLVVVYRYFLGSNCYFIIKDINKSKKYTIKSNDFELKSGGNVYSFKKNDDGWYMTNPYKEKITEDVFFKIEKIEAKITENKNKANHKNIITNIFSFLIICPIVVIIFLESIAFLPHTENGDIDVASLIEENGLSHTGTINASGKSDYKTDKIISVKGEKVILTAYNSDYLILDVSSDSVWIDENDNSIKAKDLVGKKICVSYIGEDGETCYFIGQYNKDYKWNGRCNICAYLNNTLYYTTDDKYVDGILVSYKRFSQYKNRWIYTEKTIDENNNTFGDTWSYEYKDIIEKDHVTEFPVEEDLYLVREVKEILKDSLIKHYRGAYNIYQDWFDLSGEAYSFSYKQGHISELYKGTFVGKSRYGKGLCVRPKSDGTFEVYIGVFHDLNGENVGDVQVEYHESLQDIQSIIEDKRIIDEIDNSDWYY